MKELTGSQVKLWNLWCMSCSFSHTYSYNCSTKQALILYSVHKPLPMMKEMICKLTADVIQPPTESHTDASSIIHIHFCPVSTYDMGYTLYTHIMYSHWNCMKELSYVNIAMKALITLE